MSLLIPGSNIYQTETINLFRSQRLMNDDIIIENGRIKNLTDPISLQDISNKNYVDKTLKFTQEILETTIDTQSDTTYTAEQLIGGIINRNPNGSSRFDSFATVSEMLASLGTFAVIGTFFKITINNTSTANDSIIINYNDLNITGITNNIIIYSGASAIFYCFLLNDDSGNLTINSYYTNTINKGMSNFWKRTTEGSFFSIPLRTYQLINNYVPIYNFQIFSNDIPPINNCIFNILGDYSVNTLGLYDFTGTLPSATQITESLGLNNEQIEEGVTFNFTVKCTAFIEHLPSLYSYQILSDGTIDLDPNSIFTIEFSELSWKYANYSIIANPEGSSNLYTIYCNSFFDTMTQ